MLEAARRPKICDIVAQKLMAQTSRRGLASAWIPGTEDERDHDRRYKYTGTRNLDHPA